MAGLRDDLALLRDRQFTAFFVTRIVGAFGSSFMPVALAFSVLHLPGGTPELLSVVLACESVPMVAFMLVGGLIADRVPRARVLRAGLLLSGAASGALGLLFAAGVDAAWALGGAAALSGIGIALLYPALVGLVPEVLPTESLQAGNALLNVARNGAFIVGLVSSGALVAGVGGAQALLLGAALFGAAALISLVLPVRVPVVGEGRGFWADLVGGWREFVSHEWLWVVVASWSLLVLFFDAAYGVIGPVLADGELGGAAPWSWILAAQAAGDVVGGLIGMRWRPRRPILVAVVAAAATVPLAFFALGLGAPLWVDLATMFAGGVGFGLFGVMWSTTMQLRVDPEALSRVASYDALGSLVFQPLGLLLGGPAVVALGPRTAMLVCAVGLLIVCLAPLLSADARRVGWPTPQPAPDGMAG